MTVFFSTRDPIDHEQLLTRLGGSINRSGTLEKKPERANAGPTLRLLPRRGRWLIRSEDKNETPRIFLRFEDAYKRAGIMARNSRGRLLVFGRQNELIDKIDHRVRRKAMRRKKPTSKRCKALVVEGVDGGWAIRAQAAREFVATFHRKKKAVKVARGLAERIGAKLRIHTRSGKLQQELDFNK